MCATDLLCKQKTCSRNKQRGDPLQIREGRTTIAKHFWILYVPARMEPLFDEYCDYQHSNDAIRTQMDPGYDSPYIEVNYRHGRCVDGKKFLAMKKPGEPRSISLKLDCKLFSYNSP